MQSQRPVKPVETSFRIECTVIDSRSSRCTVSQSYYLNAEGCFLPLNAICPQRVLYCIVACRKQRGLMLTIAFGLDCLKIRNSAIHVDLAQW